MGVQIIDIETFQQNVLFFSFVAPTKPHYMTNRPIWRRHHSSADFVCIQYTYFGTVLYNYQESFSLLFSDAKYGD